MRALIYEGTKTLTIKDVENPTPEQEEVLVRVHATGICGSDMHAYFGHDARRPAPLILGHEAAGIVVTGSDEGQRVTVNPLVACGQCLACKVGKTNLCGQRQIISMPPRQGAFAEMIRIPSQNLISVPDHVPLEKAALAEPMACGWHAVRLALETSDIEPEHAKCLVLGGGAIGFGAALALSALGAHEITLVEPNAMRRENLANHCNFNLLTDANEVAESSMDIIVDGVGYVATRTAACALAKPGSVIAHIGLGSAEGGIDVRRLTLQEITFFGTYTYTATDFEETAQAIFDGRFGDLTWPELRPLDHGIQAFKDLAEGQVTAPKIILQI